MELRQGKFHVSRCKAQRIVGKAPHCLMKSLVLPPTKCLLWRYSCPLLASAFLSLSEEIAEGPWGKDGEIGTLVQENKIGYQREWTDDAARWNCSLHSRSWEQLLLSLKVIVHIPIRVGRWWHTENLLSLLGWALPFSSSYLFTF